MGWDRLWWSAVLPLPLQSQNTNVAPIFSIFTYLSHIIQCHNIRFWFSTTSYHDVTASHVNRIVNHDTGKGRRWGKCWYLFTFWNIYWQVLMVINCENLEDILRKQISWFKGEIGLSAVPDTYFNSVLNGSGYASLVFIMVHQQGGHWTAPLKGIFLN